MKYSDCGWVWLGNKRPFTEWREIIKGRNKGMIEIVLPEGKVKIQKSAIERWPKEE